MQVNQLKFTFSHTASAQVRLTSDLQVTFKFQLKKAIKQTLVNLVNLTFKESETSGL